MEFPMKYRWIIFFKPIKFFWAFFFFLTKIKCLIPDAQTPTLHQFGPHKLIINSKTGWWKILTHREIIFHKTEILLCSVF